jgi:UDP-GlcNAc:undecaprenyl-phosphate/decaprenyl-phosphate GlcNAc-1-phosphate transferase
MTPDTTLILTATAVSFLTATLLVPRARRAACRYGLTDRPGRGKIHQQAIPYLGGAAIVLAVAGSISVLPAWTATGAAILVGGVIVGLVGLVDDVRNLGPGVKLTAEAAAASVAVAGGVGVQLFGGPLDDVLTVGWLVLVTNAFNLLDNMDGAAAAVAVCTSVMLLAMAIVGEQPLVIGLAGVVGGASLGFLIYNWHPATIYMGDTGSLFLGFILAAAVSTLRFPATRVAGGVAAVLMVLPALFDTTLVVLSRVGARRPVCVGGTDHTAHRLLRLGVPPTCVVAILGAASVAGGGLGVAVGRGVVPVGPALVAVLSVAVPSLAMLLRIPVYEEADAGAPSQLEVVSVETPGLASDVA